MPRRLSDATMAREPAVVVRDTAVYSGSPREAGHEAQLKEQRVNSSRLNNTTVGYVIPLTSRYQVYQESTRPTRQARPHLDDVAETHAARLGYAEFDVGDFVR